MRGTLEPRLRDGGVADALETRSSPRVLPYQFRGSMSKRLGICRSQKIGDAGAVPLGRGAADPVKQETASRVFPFQSSPISAYVWGSQQFWRRWAQRS